MNAEPVAMLKAKSLHNFASHSGMQLNTFALVLTEAEAAELLEWYAKDYAGVSAAFDVDIEIARRTKNPWPVLKNFNVYGLAICRANLVLN